MDKPPPPTFADVLAGNARRHRERQAATGWVALVRAAAALGTRLRAALRALRGR